MLSKTGKSFAQTAEKGQTEDKAVRGENNRTIQDEGGRRAETLRDGDGRSGKGPEQDLSGIRRGTDCLTAQEVLAGKS